MNSSIKNIEGKSLGTGTNGDINDAPQYFDDPATEYRVATSQAAFFDRGERGWIRVEGRDRRTWLNNLITNDIRGLAADAGCYAFALDVKGRIQFDLNVFNAADALWLDVDATIAPKAIKNLELHAITEDVRMVDVSHSFARLGCVGPRSGDIAARLGVRDYDTLPALTLHHITDVVMLFRHDFTGMPGFELTVSGAPAADWLRRITQAGAAPVGRATLEVLRIEAGIPMLGRELDDTVLPAETGCLERAVSISKGCYLGQEIVERMRSRGSLARRLVRLHLSDAKSITPPCSIFENGNAIGRVTSLARHPVRGDWHGLGYLKTKISDTARLSIGEDGCNIDGFEWI